MSAGGWVDIVASEDFGDGLSAQARLSYRLGDDPASAIKDARRPVTTCSSIEPEKRSKELHSYEAGLFCLWASRVAIAMVA